MSLPDLMRKDRDVSVDPIFQELYEREYQKVFRAAYVICGDRSAAEDSTHEAFARCLERWGRLKDEPWVAGWVTSTALNHARRALRRRREPDPSRGNEPDADAAVDLWQGIRALPRRQQEAVMLHYGADLAITEVAMVMKCEEGTVKSHLHRAREALRKYLAPVIEEVPDE